MPTEGYQLNIALDSLAYVALGAVCGIVVVILVLAYIFRDALPHQR